MRWTARLAFGFAAFCAVAACASTKTKPLTLEQANLRIETDLQSHVRAACGPPAPRHWRCFALVRTDTNHNVPAVTFMRAVPRPKGMQTYELLTSTPRPNAIGYGPSDLTAAYSLPSADPGLATGKGGNGPVVAIVDAFSSRTAQSDLAVYRHQYKLGICSIANGCLRILNQTGGTTTPAPDPEPTSGWPTEIALDLDMVSAICPHCKVLLIETNDDSSEDLAEGEREAVKLGAHIVSNSYGGNEPDSSNVAASYKADHVVFTASAGDDGTAVPVTGDNGTVVGSTLELPAGYPSVVAVGGTSLYFLSGNTPVEYAWFYSGGGCSWAIAKPPWQHDSDPSNPHIRCDGRSSTDVSAVADPDTGVEIYETGGGGWQVMGGTSAAAPIIAAVYGLAGNAATLKPSAPEFIWDHMTSGNSGEANDLNNILTGTDGTCDITYMCTAGTGYNGPTGWGTPNGIGAF